MKSFYFALIIFVLCQNTVFAKTRLFFKHASFTTVSGSNYTDASIQLRSVDGDPAPAVNVRSEAEFIKKVPFFEGKCTPDKNSSFERMLGHQFIKLLGWKCVIDDAELPYEYQSLEYKKALEINEAKNQIKNEDQAKIDAEAKSANDLIEFTKAHYEKIIETITTNQAKQSAVLKAALKLIFEKIKLPYPREFDELLEQ